MSKQKTEEALENVTKETTSIEAIFSRQVRGSKIYKLLFIALAGIAMSLFHLYTSGFGVFEAWQQRMITLSFVLLLIPVLFPFSSKNSLIGKIADITYLI